MSTIRPVLYATPESVSVGFYSHLNDKKYEQAFACMTPALQQQRWGGDAHYFAKGYAFTLGMHDVNVHRLTQDKDNMHAKIIVTYRDDVDLLRHDSMDYVRRAQIKDYSQISVHIREFNTLMTREMGADEERVKRIPLSTYFDENNVNLCLWYAQAHYDRVDKFLSRQRSMTAQARIIDTRYYEDDGWKISAITKPAP